MGHIKGLSQALCFFFSIMTDLPSILATSSSLGVKGKALSITKSLGRLMLCRDPTLYILTFVSLTNILLYIQACIKIYIHTVVYTKV